MTKGRIAAARGQFNGIRQVPPVCTPYNTNSSWHPHEFTTQQYLDRFSHFCTAHGRVSSGMPGHARSPKNCPLAWGDLDPHLTHDSLAHPNPLPKWHLNWLSQFCRAHYCDRLTDHTTQSLTIGRINVLSTVIRPKNISTDNPVRVLVCKGSPKKKRESVVKIFGFKPGLKDWGNDGFIPFLSLKQQQAVNYKTSTSNTYREIRIEISQKDLCKENEMFLNSEIVIENVMLWTQTETSTDFLNVMPNVKPINKCRSTCWWEKPWIIQQSSDTYHKSTSNCRLHAFNSFYRQYTIQIRTGLLLYWRPKLYK